VATEDWRGLEGDDLLYLVLVDRFENGDPENDANADLSDPIAFHGGDLAGVASRLDKLVELGVTAIWLTPVFQMQSTPFHGHGAFHGYWVDDLDSIDPRFGGESALVDLSTKAHDLGLKVYLDMVYNHVGYTSPRVSTHPDWFHQNGTIQNWEDPVERENGDVHGLPDLDQDLSEVREYLFERTKYWVEALALDGLRIDAVGHLPSTFLSDLNEELEAAGYGDVVLLGEVYDGNAWRLATQKRESSLDAVFDFPLHFAAVDAFCDGGDFRRLATALATERLVDDPRQLVTFLDNHDRARFFTACQHSEEKVRAALEFLFSVRGVPSLMYGTEAGMKGEAEVDVRADMDWSSDVFTQTIQRAQARRSQHPSLSRGTSHILHASKDLLHVVREADGEFASIVFKRSDAPASFPIQSPMGEPLWVHNLMGDSSGSVSLFRSSNDSLAERWRADWASLPESLSVRLDVLDVELSPDEVLYLAGDGPELGGWQPDQALGPFEQTDEGWTLTVQLPPWTPLTGKLIARSPDGDVRWSEAADTTFFIREADERIELSW